MVTDVTSAKTSLKMFVELTDEDFNSACAQSLFLSPNFGLTH